MNGSATAPVAVMASTANGTKKSTRDATDWSHGSADGGMLPFRDYLGPLFLMTVTPCFTMIFFHVCTKLNGNFVDFARLVYANGSLVQTLFQIWPNSWYWPAYRIIGTFMAFQLLLMKIVPGRTFHATVTATGHVPIYKANGMACYIITLGKADRDGVTFGSNELRPVEMLILMLARIRTES
jgi:hypothetical protein